MIGLQFIADLYGLKFKEIAGKIGVSPMTVNDWVKGRRPIPKARLKQLSELFGGLSPELFTSEELTEFQQLEIQIKALEGKAELTEGRIRKPTAKEKGLKTKELEAESLHEKLEIIKATEPTASDLKDLVKKLYYQIGESERSKTDKISRYMKMVNNLISILEQNEIPKIEAIEHILYYFKAFYGVDKLMWNKINPLVSSSKYGGFYRELDDLLNNYGFNESTVSRKY